MASSNSGGAAARSERKSRKKKIKVGAETYSIDTNAPNSLPEVIAEAQGNEGIAGVALLKLVQGALGAEQAAQWRQQVDSVSAKQAATLRGELIEACFSAWGLDSGK